MTDPRVEFVISTLGEMVAQEGGKLRLQSFNGEILKVFYDEGKTDECSDCVISTPQLERLLIESLKVHAPYVTKVEVSS
ncbi:hypothetical protein ACFLVL_00220 [Chloroflexota bacterium]